jgi:hypothetical protein
MCGKYRLTRRRLLEVEHYYGVDDVRARLDPLAAAPHGRNVELQPVRLIRKAVYVSTGLIALGDLNRSGIAPLTCSAYPILLKSSKPSTPQTG